MRASALSPKNSALFPANAFPSLSLSPGHTRNHPNSLTPAQEGFEDPRCEEMATQANPALLMTKMTASPMAPSLRSRGKKPHQPSPVPVSAKKGNKESVSFLKGALGGGGSEEGGLRWRKAERQRRKQDTTHCLSGYSVTRSLRGPHVRPIWARYPL